MAGPGERSCAVALTALVFWIAGGLAHASSLGQAEAYLLLGGGSHYHVDGLDSGTRPAANLGAGVSFGWLSLEGSLSWTRLEWQRAAICIMWAGAHCDPISFEGDVVGVALQARLTPFVRGTLLRPYLTAGAGGSHLDFRSDLDGSISTWGMGVVAGGGVEIEIFGGLSVDVAAMYFLTTFQDEVSPLSNTVESVLVVGTIRYYL